jgi:site-specific recombinase XerD
MSAKESIRYGQLVESYGYWLDALNYEPKNARCAVERIRWFSLWLTERGIHHIDQISQGDILEYFTELEQRINPRSGNVLSAHTLKCYQKELRRFGRYLQESGYGSLGVEISYRTPLMIQLKEVVFTPAEIQLLYDSCQDDAFGLRDRAMLALCYGCGLRRNEAAALCLEDVSLSRGLLYVKKGKNYRERYVPMSLGVISDLREYLLGGRTQLQNPLSGNHFFLSYAGRPVQGQSLGNRFKQLKKRCRIEKPGSLHSLRHSIATHLLERGMALKQIARFLGHRSLESTQIYTHIVKA